MNSGHGTNFEMLVPTQKRNYSEVPADQLPMAVSLPLMEVQPAEVLVYIFRQLYRLEDIVKCFNACERWKQIIGGLFKDKG